MTTATGSGTGRPAGSCPHCGAANGGDARFCGACGKAMSATELTQSSVADTPVLIGREIAGRYRILAKLGEGGMGAVFRAEQISLKRTVAVKLLRPEILGNQMLLRRFNAEAEAVAKLNHPNTVNIYDFGQDADGTLFIAMEMIEGRSLRSVIQSEAPLPPRRAFAIAVQVAAALADAHAHSIVHRDLKPDNVMLQDRGRERDIVRVLDFGIAKLRDDNRATQMEMTQQGDMLGTPQYMAPEQIRAEAIDGRTDVYALGCLLYVMLTGRLPHEASTVLALLSKHLTEQPVPPSQRRPELGLSPAIDRLVLSAMAKDPKARPPTMEAYGEQIAALLAAQPAAPGGPTTARAASQGAADLRADTPAAYSMAQSGARPVGPPTAGQPVSAAPTPAAFVPSQYPPAQPMAQGYPVARYPMPALPTAPVAPMMANRPAGFVQMAPGMPMAAPGYTAQPPRSHLPLILGAVGIGIGLLVVGIVVVAASQHHRSGSSLTDDVKHDEPSRDEPSRDEPSHDQPSHDEPSHDLPSDLPPGEHVDVGQGVQLIVPSGFKLTTQKGYSIATDVGRGVAIVAGPLTAADGSDAQQLARSYAASAHVTFKSMGSIEIAGVDHPMALFEGPVNGVAMTHVAVPLIGDSYRVAMICIFPKQLGTNPAFQNEVSELFQRRIILP